MDKKKPLSPAQRKARQRANIRAWVMKKTDGEITTAEGYVMMIMKRKQGTNAVRL